MSETVISVYRVAPDGAIALAAANLPFQNLQWTRTLSTCGSFSAHLVGDFPLEWPGRYLLVRGDRPEVGIIEKVAYGEEDESVRARGRFAESLLARRQFGAGGGSVAGANWRQAATAAFSSWPLDDAPAIAMGDGTESPSGSSYAIRGDKGETAMEALYAVTAAQGAYPTLALDWAAGALELSIATGADRTRAQSDRPVMVFSLEMATAQATSYSGDYSVACSSVVAYATGASESAQAVTVEVEVPEFDPDTMWKSVAAEDVSSLCPDSPTTDDVRSAGALRAYDHMAALAVDVTVLGGGYGTSWDLADTCEVDVPEAGVSCSARIEEVREVVKKEGATLEVSLGSKRISKVARAAMRLR